VTTVIDALPPGPSTNDPDNFDPAADALIAALPKMIQQQNTANAETAANAEASAESAQAAAGSASDADGSAGQALVHRNAAEGFKTAAEAAKTAAETARDAAAGYVDALKAASTTLLAIGVGNKTFLGAGLAGKGFGQNQTLKAANPANAAQWMVGTVSAYVSNGASSSLTLAVSRVSPTAGGNTVANWSLTLSGEDGVQGPTGGVTGGPLEGALWQKKGNDVPSATTPDVWSAGGNFVPMIGTAAITGLAAAPQAGAQVTLLATGTFPITASANLKVKGLASGSSYTCAPGDELDVRAETTTLFHVTIRKADGTPTLHNLGALHNLRRFTSSGVFTPTKTGWHKVTVVGGSGSGGAATAGNVGTGIAGASGSGAGGFASGMRFLVAGQPYVVMVGAGGVLVQATDSNKAVNGNDGSGSSFTGTGISAMGANGGGGGRATVAASTTVAGGIGGTAYGGDMNVKGGDGGAARTGSYRSAVASGGGAVGLRGAGFNGGSAICPDSHLNNICVASGGAGVGGRGGNATTSLSATENTYTCGGGSAGAASDAVSGVDNDSSHVGINVYGAPGGTVATVANDLDAATGSGKFPAQSDSASGPGYPGGGMAGFYGVSAAAGGMFAGGGGRASTSGQTGYAGTGGDFGGGAGGCTNVVGSTVSQVMNGGAGSAGAVWIEF
jgi:hypothetical protein